MLMYGSHYVGGSHYDDAKAVWRGGHDPPLTLAMQASSSHASKLHGLTAKDSVCGLLDPSITPQTTQTSMQYHDVQLYVHNINSDMSAYSQWQVFPVHVKTLVIGTLLHLGLAMLRLA